MAADVDVVLILEPVLQHLELQHADHAHDDALHTGTQLAEDLDSSLLGKLLHALDELLAQNLLVLQDV